MAGSRRLTWVVLVFTALAAPACAQEIVFASLEDARRILATSDDYSKAMSAFDRALRMRSAAEPTESEFLAFAATAAMAWSADEREAVEAAYKEIHGNVARLGLPLPPRVHFVRTSGAEDSHAAYTRQDAIMLPSRMLETMRGPALARLVAHELYHVATRAHPKIVDPLYAAIGFQRCGDVELPPSLAARRITNPDAPRDAHCIRVRVRDEPVWALPVLVATATKAEILAGGDFLSYVTVVLLLVEWTPGPAVARALIDGTAPRVRTIQEVAGFFDQIGRNTRYLIHPEEITADNFTLLALGRVDVPSPAILERIRKILADYAAR